MRSLIFFFSMLIFGFPVLTDIVKTAETKNPSPDLPERYRTWSREAHASCKENGNASLVSIQYYRYEPQKIVVVLEQNLYEANNPEPIQYGVVHSTYTPDGRTLTSFVGHVKIADSWITTTTHQEHRDYVLTLFSLRQVRYEFSTCPYVGTPGYPAPLHEPPPENYYSHWGKTTRVLCQTGSEKPEVVLSEYTPNTEFRKRDMVRTLSKWSKNGGARPFIIIVVVNGISNHKIYGYVRDGEQWTGPLNENETQVQLETYAIKKFEQNNLVPCEPAVTAP